MPATRVRRLVRPPPAGNQPAPQNRLIGMRNSPAAGPWLKCNRRDRSGVLAMASMFFAVPLVMAALSGCGQATPSHQAPADAKSTTACRTVTRSSTRLVLQRSVQFPLSFSFPAHDRTSEPEAVRAVAVALCSLPELPPHANVAACAPLVRYTIRFYASNHRLATVHLTPSGCMPVSGIGPPRTGDASNVWHAFARALGLTGTDIFKGHVASQ
jgi:hypothetical protein